MQYHTERMNFTISTKDITYLKMELYFIFLEI